MAIDGDGSGSTRIRLNTANAPTARPESDQPKMRVYDASGSTNSAPATFEVPFAPQTVSMSNLSAGWAMIDRPGRAPLVVPTGRQVPRVAFEFTIVDSAGGSVLGPISELQIFVADPQRNVAILGFPVLDQFATTSRWRIEQCDIEVTQLRQGNVPTMALCRMTLIARNDAAVSIGPTAPSSKPVTIDDPDIGTVFADGTGKAAAAANAKQRPAVPPLIVGTAGKNRPVYTRPGLQKPVYTRPGLQKPVYTRPGLAPKNSPKTAPVSVGKDLGFTATSSAIENKRAWAQLCLRLGRATAHASSVAAEAGYTTDQAPVIGASITVKDTLNGWLSILITV